MTDQISRFSGTRFCFSVCFSDFICYCFAQVSQKVFASSEESFTLSLLFCSLLDLLRTKSQRNIQFQSQKPNPRRRKVMKILSLLACVENLNFVFRDYRKKSHFWYSYLCISLCALHAQKTSLLNYVLVCLRFFGCFMCSIKIMCFVCSIKLTCFVCFTCSIKFMCLHKFYWAHKAQTLCFVIKGRNLTSHTHSPYASLAWESA